MYVRSCSETGRQPARISRCNGELSRLAGRQVRAKSRKHHNRAAVLFWILMATRQAKSTIRSDQESIIILPGRVDPVVMPLQAGGVPSACVERGCVFADQAGVMDVVVRNLRVASGHRLRRELRPCLHEPTFQILPRNAPEDLRNGMAHGWYSPRVPCLGYSSRLLQ